MWKFSRAKGQRTALIHSFRLCGEEDSASSDPHIYPSVEYWTTSVFAQVLPQPSIEQTKSTPHFLCIITTRIQELGWKNFHKVMKILDENILLTMGPEDPKPAVGERVILTLKSGKTLQGELRSYEYSSNSNSNPQNRKHLLTEIVVDKVKVCIYDVKELKVVER